VPEPSPPPQVYAVKHGDTLYAIAGRFGCDVDDLIQANGIANPNALQVGQELRIPSTTIDTGPSARLLPNSEFVNSPAYLDFDTATFCARRGGYLCSYQENVGGQMLSGLEIVNLVVHHYSVGPRLLLAVVEHESGWLTDPNPSGSALGRRNGGWATLHQQLAWAADTLNEGYYDWRGRGMPLKIWGDGTATRYAPTLNAATAGLQYFYSLNTSRSEWQVLVGEGPGSFIETYRKLFGDPAQYAIVPLVPADVTCPTLALPWSKGELWFYTGGPHGGWNKGSGWGAIDAVPDEGYLGCQVASAWATAAAPGLVIYSQDGEVMVDLDEDGHEETGWVLFYLHLSNQGRVPVDTRVKQGDHIGHPSCDGGFSESTHLHFARKFNGEWIAADGPLPLVLSGWQFHSSGSAYEGTATRGGQQRTACECTDAAINGLVADR
jgi:murein DD-endopeptidase MepM/ murein hydrolase activator NlpD